MRKARRQTRAGFLFTTLLALGAVTPLATPVTHADITPPGGDFIPISSVRIANTATGIGGAATPFAAGETRTYHVSGVGSIPTSGVSAVAVDIGVLSTSGSGYVTAYATGQPRPTTSNVNFRDGDTPESNSAMIALGSNGNISVYISGGAANTDLTID